MNNSKVYTKMAADEYTQFVCSEVMGKIRRNILNTLKTGAILPLKGNVVAQKRHGGWVIADYKLEVTMAKIDCDMVEYYGGVLKTLQAIDQEGMTFGVDSGKLGVAIDAATSFINKGYGE